MEEHPCFDVPGARYEDALHDFRHCGKFGRPLFAVMLQDRESESSLSLEEQSWFVNHSVSSDRLFSITLRVLLSKKQWWQDSLAKASVLATRVQMGLASYDFVLESTSKGYGNLVQFRSPTKTHDPGFGTASVAFPSDPVCAAMAMGRMRKKWSVTNAKSSILSGRKPEFWAREASLILDGQLFLPERSDFGEVFTVLYMLFCGDELREEKDPCMRKFSVSLKKWLEKQEDASLGSPEQDRPATAAEQLPVRRSQRMARDSQTREGTLVLDAMGQKCIYSNLPQLFSHPRLVSTGKLTIHVRYGCCVLCLCDLPCI